MANERKQRVRVIRAFFERGNKTPIGIGTVKDFPISQAAELQSARKVDFVASDTKLTSSEKIKDEPKADPKK